MLDALICFAENNPAALIAVKPHPADHADHTREYLLPHLTNCPNLRLLDRYENIPFYNQHLIVINNSGAGLEACIWGRPIVVFAPSWDGVYVKQYVEEGVAEFADSAAQLTTAILKIQAAYPAYQARCLNFTEQQLAQHGHAAEQIAMELTC